jgi:error-prone DNA polymerase
VLENGLAAWIAAYADQDEAYVGDGRMINSAFLDGMTVLQAKEEVASRLEGRSIGNAPEGMREVNDNTLEERASKYHILRLGFRQVKGLREDDINILIKGRKKKYTSIHELRETGLSEATLEKLADADAFRSIGHDRQKALWEVTTKDHQQNALISNQSNYRVLEEKIVLPEMTVSEHVVQDYASTSLSLKAHPVSFVRKQLEQLHVRSAASLEQGKNGDYMKVAGLILVRQRPGTASGICFITIEDETGTANLVVFQKLFDQYRKEIIQSRLLMVEGQLQKEGEVIHVIVKRCYNVSRLLKQLTEKSEDLSLKPMSRADETTYPFLQNKKTKESEMVQGNIFGEGRNFK